MALSLASCRCCRGVLHRLPSQPARTFSTSQLALNDGGFKLPTRDWSRPVPEPASNEKRSQGKKQGGGGGGFGTKKREGGGSGGFGGRDRNNSNQNRSGGFGMNNGGNRNRDNQINQNKRDSFNQGLSKWGIGQDTKSGGGFGAGSRRDDKPPRREGGGKSQADVFGAPLQSRGNARKVSEEQPQSVGQDASSSYGGGALEEDDNDRPRARKHHGRERKGRGESHSLLDRLRSDGEDASLPTTKHHRRNRQPEQSQPEQPRKPKAPKPKVVPVRQEKEVYIPRTVSTANLAKIFGVKLFPLQAKMLQLEMTEDERRPDYLLSAEQACNIAIEYGYNPIVDDEASFDIYPEQVDFPTDPVDGPLQPLRPPVVTIMGHVDHGKTTLLDSLRHTSVAASEAGGITQHIGAFSVPLSSLLPSADPKASAATITFLDTPGHAAFTAMRARGASVTDLVVLVVAADDGVMPQTREVLDLAKNAGDTLGLVVAINKCDKPGVDFNKIKSALGAEGIFLEEDGGDVPSVKVSGLKKTGLDDLVETLATLAEIRDLRARRDGKAEGYVLESRVDKGRGNVATVLVTKGTLRAGSSIVAGTTWCRVRQMQDDKGKPIREAPPGTPVSVTGWKELPSAGDELLEAVKGEDEAKKAVGNRKRDIERKKLMKDAEQINAKRREERLRVEAETAAAEAAENGEVVETVREVKDDFKTLRLIIKADVSGTVEAVVGSLEHIGNKEAGVRIIQTGVGEVNENDIALAETSDATIIGFNVSAPRAIQTLAKNTNVPLQLESVIYRLIEKVRHDVAALLPPTIEYSVKGEASVLQLFQINVKRKEFMTIAGCRVNNGVLDKSQGVRVLRGPDRKVVFEGSMGTLKHLKKDVQDVRKGMECGIALEGFTDIKEGDEIVTFVKVEVLREL
ncbi:translation initiation factor IF-2 [Cryptococcus amylolentus CBS 6273]|uniref:Translation initiation factor IF-2, mitochondrial n=1 Tax=Cryptococcus amylolentus CBS 6273 TaxID=1296118 RepID=A0A1E3K9A6_9TREE|nr:translation initiation factor IF-2 [Cryptococcus amylolentus CBS 6273]